MPAKKKRPSGPDTPDDSTAWRVILHDIQSQNRTTLEALQTSHDRLTDKFQELKGQSDARFDLLMAALRDIRADLKGEIADVRADLKTEIARVETNVARVEAKVDKLETKVERVEVRIERIDTKVDKLVPLEERVVALERRGA